MAEETEDRSATERADDLVDRAADVVDDHGTVFRWLWIAVGVIVVAAGLAMIVFPGPVTVVVPAGLIMLAAVFGWARKLLLATVEKGAEAKDAYDRAERWVKVLTWLASACVAAAVLAWMVL
jgi:hypothetical protein